ncbi:MAG: ATP-binding protein [Planctomycetota bacterium]|nr:ATP-binding protein [Planctomycetota bacterium]
MPPKFKTIPANVQRFRPNRAPWLLLLIGALLLQGPRVEAQTFLSDHLTELDGLPSSAIYDVESDPEGRVWLATRAGVAVYDGTELEVHRDLGSFGSSSAVRSLALDGQGGAWTTSGAAGGDVLHFDGVTWRASTDGGIAGLGVEIRELLSARGPERMHLVALDINGGLHAWDPELGEWALLAEGVRMATEDPMGFLMIRGAGVELLHFDGLSEVLLEHDLEDLRAVRSEGEGFHDVRRWALGSSWLGTYQDGVLSVVDEDILLGNTTAEDLPRLELDGRGGAFFGTYNQAFSWGPDGQRALGDDPSMVSAGATDIERDAFGNIWVSTLRGVTRIPPRAWVSYEQRSGLLQDEATALEHLPNLGLVIGHNGGLTLLRDGRMEQLSFLDAGARNLETARVLDLEPDGMGGLWLACSGLGAAHMDREGVLTWRSNQELGLPVGVPGSREDVVGFARTTDGALWVCGTKGLARDRGQGFEPVSTPDRKLFWRRILAHPEGGILLLTAASGLQLWRDGVWTRYDGENAQASNVFAVAFPSSGPPLVGTMAGLRVLGEAGLEPAPPGLDGLGAVFTITEDSRGWLWIGTDRGVFRWRDGRLRRYTVREGLAGQEINRDAALEGPDGRMWFGTSHGLACFDPAMVWDFPAPRLSVRGARVMGKPLAEGDGFTVGNAFELEVAVASLAGVAAPEYRYRVPGLFEEWSPPIPATQRWVSLQHPFQGELVVELQARNADEEWGPVTASPTYFVHGVFWRSWWFVLLVAGSLVGFVFGMSLWILQRRQARWLRLELKQRKLELRRTELSFTRLFAANPAAQLIVEPDTGNVELANAAAAELLGLPPRLGKERNLLAHLVSIGLAPSEDEWRDALERADRETILEVVGQAGQLDLELRVGRIDLEERRRALVTATDITARRRNAEELRRTQSLRAVGELAGGLAHDFNNLLTTILGQAELLETHRPNDPMIVDRASSIRHAGQRGADLVRKLLAFGRKQVLKPETVELALVVGEVLPLLSDLFDDKLRLEVELQPDAGLVRVDRAELERVVLNLCLNARDAMPRGGVIRVEVRRDAFEGLDMVCLAVLDEGTGLAPSVRERMFEPFFTTKGELGGAGLGLSSAHGIVEQTGGTIQALDRPGGGTELRVLLPRVADPSQVLGPERTGAASGGRAPPGPRGLLVGDQGQGRPAGGGLLGGMGYRVLEASDGVDALAQLAQPKVEVDLVLTDVMMPGMGGRELGAELATLYPGMPVAYMSGYLDSATEEMQGRFLSKPFGASELAELVQSLELPNERVSDGPGV